MKVGVRVLRVSILTTDPLAKFPVAVANDVVAVIPIRLSISSGTLTTEGIPSALPSFRTQDVRPTVIKQAAAYISAGFQALRSFIPITP